MSAYSGGGGLSLTGDQLLLADGSAATPSYSWTSDTDTGFFMAGGGKTKYAVGGTQYINFSANKIGLTSLGHLSWASGSDPGFGSTDLRLYRDGASGVLAQRSDASATTAQSYRLYGAYTNASNYERLAFVTAADDYDIIPEAAGTGTLRGLQIGGASSRLGFYGSQAIVLQTGVGTDAASIHAALVALNLITA